MATKKKLTTDTPETTPEPQEEYRSPYRDDLDQMKADRAADSEQIKESLELEARMKAKKGNQSWKAGTNRFHRDMLRIEGMVDGRHPASPGMYHRFIRRRDVQIRQREGWKVCDANKLGDFTDEIVDMPGSTGTALIRGGLILMEIPEQFKADHDEYNDLLADQQEADIEEAAAREGLVPVGDGRFGQAGIARAARKRATDGAL